MLYTCPHLSGRGQERRGNWWKSILLSQMQQILCPISPSRRTCQPMLGRRLGVGW